MAEDKEDVKNGEEEKKPKKSKIMLIIIIVVVLILGVGGYFGWSMYKKENQDVEEVDKKEDTVIIYPMRSFIVNLMDRKGLGKRYLKVTMEFEVGSEKDRLIVEKNTPQLRDRILILLSSKQLKDINSMEGKKELKMELLSGIEEVLNSPSVRRLYFQEFVVQ